ncbi:hypothetical protein DPMN_124530 [Dreissena polymorpha]|uniref:Uncharacterized protein n=1 Tax=Dreissena polymorpha TaxID=45954 RepID=A0A9D4JS91_DREPO|nr:hypothetical protein DPMN_124530 [Dreissena polymorpha]
MTPVRDSQTSMHLQVTSQTVSDGANTVLAPAGDYQTVPNVPDSLTDYQGT